MGQHGFLRQRGESVGGHLLFLCQVIVFESLQGGRVKCWFVGEGRCYSQGPMHQCETRKHLEIIVYGELGVDSDDASA